MPVFGGEFPVLKTMETEISQFTKFQALSLDCNHVEEFQKSENYRLCMNLGDAISELETFVWIWATFDKSQPGYYAMKHIQRCTHVL